ncbi:MAG: thymidine kinase [Bacilli bacterium]|nr:thymidine kinase [Bacilli bacterium]
MSKLYFRYGAMNCGKSSNLMQVAHNYNENNKEVVVIKSSIDTKADDYLESRVGLKRKVDILIKPEESFEKYYDYWNDHISCILVDEAQFLTTKQVEELWIASKMLEIPVICYGLKTDFKSNLFEGSKRLLELADELEELVTICSCGKRAKFNARYVNNEFQEDGSSILIDGSVSSVEYRPMCGKCYMKNKYKNIR